ncbi:diacylglycerol kinase family protein [Isoptericola sp. b441]|uniref:Diacylglycerol kinase family protein n=1 Tax=Actinotalea lenta TaxID=3064654 RepID=A0ABT9DA12_9CELL|nr:MULTISPECIES: diacylglycerol kinase family protein [unclassified Isoptericola]MDO8107749.1 diacylglycerol kinase family protein [Isoptericola sp. b441]MDO8120580.1 diacylglycerol kinase family protein [Isoptericola sp. b490]
MSGARLGVVVNPTAGHGRGARRGHQLVEALERRGHEVRDLTGATPEAALGRARQAVVDGLDALVVVGGDGMVHLGVNVVAGTDLPLGVVAAGSGNDIARAGDLPLHDVSASVAALERGLEHGGRQVDAVRTGPPGYEATRWFLAVLSAGFDAAVNARANTYVRPRGTARYVRAVLDELVRFRPYGYRVTLDGEVWEQRSTLVSVANTSSFGGGMRIAPDATWDDGLLDVVIAGPLSRTGLIGLFPRVFPGTHVRHPACTVVRARSVLLEPSHAGPLPPVAYADGERVGPLPLLAEVVPSAVRLLA